MDGSTPQHFGAFVRQIAAKKDMSRLNEHFLPQTAFCGVDQGMRFDAVYRLEEIEEWGPALVTRLNLTAETADGWKGGFFKAEVGELSTGL